MDFGELSRIPRLQISDYILVTNESGTKSYRIWDESLYELADMKSSTNLRRNIYRGRNLGTAVTDAQWEEIRSGRFRGMFLGDYWVIGGINWVIMDFNYWINQGDNDGTSSNQGLSTPHLAMMSQQVLDYGKPMYNSGNGENGYINSDLRKTGLDNCKAKIRAAFGSDHILTVKRTMSNAIRDEGVQGRIWVDSEVDLPSASMLMGYTIFQSTPSIIYLEGGPQFSLYVHDPRRIFVRSVNLATCDLINKLDAMVMSGSAPMLIGASVNVNWLGIRPVFAIKG